MILMHDVGIDLQLHHWTNLMVQKIISEWISFWWEVWFFVCTQWNKKIACGD